MSTSEVLRRTAIAGVAAGGAVVYLCLVGMVETFNVRNVLGGEAQLSRILLLGPPFIAAYLASVPRLRAGKTVGPSVPAAVGSGAGVGAISGAIVALGIGLVNLLGQTAVMNVFRSVTFALMQIVTFQRSTVAGTVVLVALSIVAGLIGGALGSVRRPLRVPVLVGLIVVLALGGLQTIVRPALSQLGMDTTWLYSTTFGGLTYLGGILGLVVGAAASAAWIARKERERATPPAEETGSKGPKVPRGILIGLPAAIVLLALPLLLGTFLSAVLGAIGIFLLMALGLNIVVGYAGLLDLGYVAFFAVGAYALAVLTAAPTSGSSIHPQLPFLVAIPVVVVIAVATGLLIGGPVLRLRGDYLAIVTLGFGEIARVLVTSDWLRSFLGGAQGLIAIPAPQLNLGGWHVDFRDPQPFYYLVLAFCAVAVFVSWRLANSRIGRAWNAMREDEQVAEAMGVSTVRYKLLAFGTGAAIGSLSGALFAVQIGSLSPASFVIFVSIQALAIIILGGMGSIPGVVLGAVVLVGLPGFLTEFAEFQPLIFGAVIVGIMILRPQGLIPNVRRMRELHEEERAQDEWTAARGETPPITVGGEATS
ncbi:MAG TPA: branched-chain amino acid ABC transporter permease [Actinomycetota bacterium]|nr:branched-chain amino acid ABC transporter permease [Actinomycetota bacterium]